MKHKNIDEVKASLLEFGNTFNVVAKAENESSSDELTIEGFASTDDKDRTWDIIPGTTWADPEAQANYLKNPIVLAYHDHKQPIGVCESLEVKQGGLYVRIKLQRSLNEKVFDAVKSGVIKSFSVGFRMLDIEYDKGEDAYIITKLELVEISVVSVPCNPNAVFQVIKSLSSEVKEHKMPQALDTTQVTTQEAVAKAVQEELTRIKSQEAQADAVKAAEAAKQAALATQVADMVKSASAEQATKLVDDIKASLEEGGLMATIKQYKEEIEAQKVALAAQTSKMQHSTGVTAKGSVSELDQSNAVLLAAILRKDVFDTKFGAQLKQKAAGFDGTNTAVHIPGAHTVNSSDWETTFETNFWMDVRRELVVEPLFRSMNMSTAVVRIPVVPEQDYASYIGVDDLKTDNSTATVNSGNRPLEIMLTAHKLSAADLIGEEEDEDTILAIVPIIRDNLVRRMARSSDRSLLRGVGATKADPIKGLAQYAIDASNVTTLSIGGGDKLTALKLQQTRREIGVFGIRPQDVVYIVSTEGYYDLLEDADMRKYFDVGPDKATILQGQVAVINGSRIIVSDEFAPKALNAVAAIVVNMRNYMVGNLRGLTVKSDMDIKKDATLIVATRRFGMVEMEDGGVAAVRYAA